MPTIGGKQFVVYYLAKSLQKLGHNVRVVSPGSWRKDKLNQFPFPVHKYAGLGTGRLKRKFENVEWIIKAADAMVKGASLVKRRIRRQSVNSKNVAHHKLTVSTK